MSTEQIKPCLWYDKQGKEAAEFYCALFKDSAITSADEIVVEFRLGEQRFMALNGGPMFKFTPAISQFVTLESDEEIDAVWEKLLEGGSVMMPLDKYDWSERYGWLNDRFGLSWQIFKGKYEEVNSRITPCFLFTDNRFGMADEAVKFYTSVFPNSSVDGVAYYPDGDPSTAGKVMHAQFILDGKVFMAMDGPGEHNFTFNEAFSFVVTCNDQKEIDYYWEKFSEGGREDMCGWVQDKFGISWQIVPAVLKDLMNDPATRQKTVDAFMKMKKFDIDGLMK